MLEYGYAVAIHGGRKIPNDISGYNPILFIYYLRIFAIQSTIENQIFR